MTSEGFNFCVEVQMALLPPPRSASVHLSLTPPPPCGRHISIHLIRPTQLSIHQSIDQPMDLVGLSHLPWHFLKHSAFSVEHSFLQSSQIAKTGSQNWEYRSQEPYRPHFTLSPELVVSGADDPGNPCPRSKQTEIKSRRLKIAPLILVGSHAW